MLIDPGGAFIIGFIIFLFVREGLSLAGIKRWERFFRYSSNLVVIVLLVILAVIVLNRFSRAVPW